MEYTFQFPTKKDTGLGRVERKKSLQRMEIMKNLYFRGPKSIPEICNECRVSYPTSAKLLRELKSEGLVAKNGRGKSVGGRKPDLYGLQEESFYLLSRRYFSRCD